MLNKTENLFRSISEFDADTDFYVCAEAQLASLVERRAVNSGGPGFNSPLVPRVKSLVGHQEGHPVRKIILQLQ
jgi:hypothetical protein